MKLISMTDFVLQNVESKTMKLSKIADYALFLKQPLTLGMFVPCDDDGNVLQIPNKYTSNLAINDEYEQAKSKVLFKDCLIQDIAKDNYLISNGSVTFWIYSKEPKIIDELTSYDFDLAVSF